MPRNDNKQPQVGGIKGFLSRAYQSMETLGTQGGSLALTTSLWAAKTAGTWGFYAATTAMIVFVPLMFEIGRERQVCVRRCAIILCVNLVGCLVGCLCRYWCLHPIEREKASIGHFCILLQQ